MKYDNTILEQNLDGKVVKFCFTNNLDQVPVEFVDEKQVSTFTQAYGIYENRFDPLTENFVKHTPMEEIMFKYELSDKAEVDKDFSSKQKCVKFVRQCAEYGMDMSFQLDAMEQ